MRDILVERMNLHQNKDFNIYELLDMLVKYNKNQPLLVQAASSFTNPTLQELQLTLVVFPQLFKNTSLTYMFEQWSLTPQAMHMEYSRNRQSSPIMDFQDFWTKPCNIFKLKSLITSILDNNQGQPAELWHIYKGVQHLTWKAKYALNSEFYPSTPSQTEISDTLWNMANIVYKKLDNGTDVYTTQYNLQYMTATEDYNPILTQESKVIEVEDYSQMSQSII